MLWEVWVVISFLRCQLAQVLCFDKEEATLQIVGFYRLKRLW